MTEHLRSPRILYEYGLLKQISKKQQLKRGLEQLKILKYIHRYVRRHHMRSHGGVRCAAVYCVVVLGFLHPVLGVCVPHSIHYHPDHTHSHSLHWAELCDLVGG